MLHAVDTVKLVRRRGRGGQRRPYDFYIVVFISPDGLIEVGRADRQCIGGVGQHGSPQALHFNPIDVFGAGDCIVDIARGFAGESHHTNRRFAVPEGNVEHALGEGLRISRRGTKHADANCTGEARRVRLVRHVFDQTALSRGTIERALWPAQHFDARQVE